MEGKLSELSKFGESNQRSMIWVQFKDPLCYMCRLGNVITSCSLTPKFACSNNLSLKRIVTEFSNKMFENSIVDEEDYSDDFSFHVMFWKNEKKNYPEARLCC